MARQRPIRILVADDDPDIRSALVSLIEDEAQFELVGLATDTAEAVAAADTEHPDVALVDVRMPGGGGVAAALGIAKVSPETKLIVLSGLDDRESVVSMLEAGAASYLVKGTSVRDIVATIKDAPAGGAVLSVEVTATVIEELTGKLKDDALTKQRQMRRLGRVQRLLDEDARLQIVYQPIVELLSGRVACVEALARFPATPRQGPGHWFKEASAVGLGAALELAAAQKATASIPCLPDGVALSVNVSPGTIVLGAFRRLVAEIDAPRLVVEVTEHAPIKDHARFNARIAPLRALGVRLAIDDAGAGFASLRHILRLEPDYIKLDHSLIEGIEHEPSAQALAAGLISFATRCGATIIAEGIERQGQLVALIDLRVPLGQGYHLAQPAPPPCPSALAISG